jgi:hypothetical protein
MTWLRSEDDRNQVQKASRQTQAMFLDIYRKISAHAAFEQHHYEPNFPDLEDAAYPKPPTHPPRSNRLDWMINRQDWPLPCRSTTAVDRRNLLPRTDPPRPPSPVNRMLIDNPGDRPLYDRFAQDSKTWWHRLYDTTRTDIPAGAEAHEQSNLALLEDTAFNNQPPLPQSQTTTTHPTPQTFATTRGTNRATLQRTLRTLLPTATTTLPRRKPPLLLPLPAAALRTAIHSAAGPHWTPPRLSPSQLPPLDQLEPLPTVMAYRERLRRIKIARGLSRLRVAHEDGDGHERGGGLVLPRNVVGGGPFVWRGVGVEVQVLQDLLRECRVVVGVLRAAGEREPRGLLEGVLAGVASGEAATVPPEGVRLAGDEWVGVAAAAAAGGVRVPRYLGPGEVQWLRFLAGECVNGGNWSGRLVKDKERDKYRLFLLFASKVRKLLDDKSPEGLFSKHDAQVEVEDLLKAINAGKDSSAVAKHEFHPHDACCWLDRMKEKGYVRFRLDPTCYGVVERPVAEFFPEHRVVWPRTTEEGERPPYLMGYIADWKKVVRDGKQPDIGEGSAIWNFFMSLAFRLGYTISQLSQDLEEQTLQIQPKQHLRDAIANWKQTTARLQGDDHAEPTPEELAHIRTALLTELAENKTMLFPARKHHFYDQQGNPQTITTWDHNWYVNLPPSLFSLSPTSYP